jgi:hypothetical protein
VFQLWIRYSKVGYDDEGADPKGFHCYRSSCQAGWFCLSGRRSAGETLRVSGDGGQRAAGGVAPKADVDIVPERSERGAVRIGFRDRFPTRVIVYV